MDYRYYLSVTSQFFFCPIPFRLDSYSSCSFGCKYCYSSARGGKRGNGIQIANPEVLKRRLERITTGQSFSILDDFLLYRIPLHFGGMSDPFSMYESRYGASLKFLKTLNLFNYPAIISTKGTKPAEGDCLKELIKGNYIVQISVTSLDARRKSPLEPGAPSGESVKKSIVRLLENGVPVSIRFQPFFECFLDEYLSIIDWFCSAGGKHIALEYLKLPVENAWKGHSVLSDVYGSDCKEMYLSRGAKRIGREWVLPATEKITNIMAVKDYANKKGVYVGVAENELSLMSDGDCCCYHDILGTLTEANLFEHNYRYAAMAAVNGDSISIDSLRDAWCPDHSVKMYLNSHSRRQTLSTISEYIKYYWNGSANGFSISDYYGIDVSCRKNEYNSYFFSDRWKDLYHRS